FPARDRIQRGSPKRFAAPQAETGVVPRAPHRVVDDQSVDERSVIVSTVRANCEELVAGARQEHVLIADATEQRAAGLEPADGYALGKIRSPRPVGISHRTSPLIVLQKRALLEARRMPGGARSAISSRSDHTTPPVL